MVPKPWVAQSAMLMIVRNGMAPAKARNIVSRNGLPKSSWARNPAPRKIRAESATLSAKVTARDWSMVPRILAVSPPAPWWAT
jgi:hypothetical protein